MAEQTREKDYPGNQPTAVPEPIWFRLFWCTDKFLSLAPLRGLFLAHNMLPQLTLWAAF
jgi:hypothetical protein